MKINKKVATVVSGLLIGGLMVGMGSIASASTTENDAAQGFTRNATAMQGMMQKIKGGKMNFKMKWDRGGMRGTEQGTKEERMKSLLDELVTEGTITQTQEDELLAHFQEKAEERKAKFEEMKNMTPEERQAAREVNKGEKPEPLSEVVEEGIISQEEADAIKDKMHELRQEKRQEAMQTRLNMLVEKEVITEDQVDDILEVLEKEAANREANFEKMKDMSKEERQAYKQEMRETRKDILTQLVKDGTITQEQSDALAKMLGKKGGHHKGGKGMFPGKGARGQRGSFQGESN